MSGSRIAKFLQENDIVGSGALWNVVHLPKREKKLPPFLDISFTGLSCRWKQKDFLRICKYIVVLVVL
jgi:hypothetical protein